MKIAIGADHAGYALKNELLEYLAGKGHEVRDFGTFSTASMDYTDVAAEVARSVGEGRFERGILVCSTGIGMSMAANKIKGVRCALLYDTFAAQLTREHNDANMMALGAGITAPTLARSITDVFLASAFSDGERHKRRIAKLMALDER